CPPAPHAPRPSRAVPPPRRPPPPASSPRTPPPPPPPTPSPGSPGPRPRPPPAPSHPPFLRPSSSPSAPRRIGRPDRCRTNVLILERKYQSDNHRTWEHSPFGRGTLADKPRHARTKADGGYCVMCPEFLTSGETLPPRG